MKKQLSVYEITKDKNKILDIHTQNLSQIELIKMKKNKVLKTMQRYLKNQELFENYLKNKLEINSEEQFNSRMVSKKELVDIFQKISEKLGNKIEKKYYDGVISIFSYNKEDNVKLNEIGKILYK